MLPCYYFLIYELCYNDNYSNWSRQGDDDYNNNESKYNENEKRNKSRDNNKDERWNNNRVIWIINLIMVIKCILDMISMEMLFILDIRILMKRLMEEIYGNHFYGIS